MALDAGRKKTKWARIIVAGVILQTLIIVLFVILVMRVRNIHVRVGSASIVNLKLNSSSSSPSFSMDLQTEVGIKNTNFGSYKFDNITITLSYGGVEVGEALLVKNKARWRSTKKVKITFEVKSPNTSKLKSHMKKDLDGGVLPLTSHAKLTGKVTVLGIFKRKKAAAMNCTMDVDTVKKEVKNVACK